jgi:hypothetical protein
MAYAARTLLLASVSLLMILGVSACKSKSETHVSDKGKVTFDQDGEKADITVETKEGESFKMSINKGELPEGWPSELEVLPGGKILFSQSEAKSNMRQISIETETSVDDALAFYKQAIGNGGWNIENTMSIGPMNMLTARKDGKELMLQVAAAEEKTNIQIIIK